MHYYVEGSNHTKCPYATGDFPKDNYGPHCPGNSNPCCLPMTTARWVEALEATKRWGMQVR